MSKKEILVIAAAAVITLLTAFLLHSGANNILIFGMSAVALVLVAMIVGDATDQLGKRMGPASTGILQSALGNLPELFVCIFALKAGLDQVVKAALIGSILGNSVLVVGLALLLGGLKNGKQVFHAGPPQHNAIMMLLSFAAMAIPSLAFYLHTPAETHINQLDILLAVVLMIVFVAFLIYSIKKDSELAVDKHPDHSENWPLALTIVILTAAGVSAAFVSDWFVESLKPAMDSLGINEVFAGLIVVAIAGNAIENVVGIQLAIKNKMDYSLSVILNSSLQIALVLYPVLIIISFFVGGAILSFVLSPLLLAAFAISVLVSTFIVFDGESIWLEGVALIGLYIIIAASFWWG